MRKSNDYFDIIHLNLFSCMLIIPPSFLAKQWLLLPAVPVAGLSERPIDKLRTFSTLGPISYSCLALCALRLSSLFTVYHSPFTALCAPRLSSLFTVYHSPFTALCALCLILFTVHHSRFTVLSSQLTSNPTNAKSEL